MGIFGIRQVVKAKPLEDIKRKFEFLVSDFNYELTAVVSPFIDSDGSPSKRHVCYFSNEKSRLQLEIVGSGDWFDCEFRRFSYGTPSLYSDLSNLLGFETFAKIEKDYNHKNYTVIYVGWEKVLQNTADLIKRHNAFFTDEQNTEIDLFDQLKEYSHKNNLEFNYLWKKIESPFFTNLKKQIAPLLTEKGFHLYLESSSLAPFDSTQLVDFVIYQKDKINIKISQLDWRDVPYIYILSKNNKLIFELDLMKQSDKDFATKILIDHLKKCL